MRIGITARTSLTLPATGGRVDDGSLAATRMYSADTESGNPAIPFLIELIPKRHEIRIARSI